MLPRDIIRLLIIKYLPFEDAIHLLSVNKYIRGSLNKGVKIKLCRRFYKKYYEDFLLDKHLKNNQRKDQKEYMMCYNCQTPVKKNNYNKHLKKCPNNYCVFYKCQNCDLKLYLRRGELGSGPLRTGYCYHIQNVCPVIDTFWPGPLRTEQDHIQNVCPVIDTFCHNNSNFKLQLSPTFCHDNSNFNTNESCGFSGKRVNVYYHTKTCKVKCKICEREMSLYWQSHPHSWTQWANFMKQWLFSIFKFVFA